MPELAMNAQTCTRCGLCVSTCPSGIITLQDGGLPHYTDGGAEQCMACGHCEAVCPSGALVLNDPLLDPTSCAPGVTEIGRNASGHICACAARFAVTGRSR